MKKTALVVTETFHISQLELRRETFQKMIDEYLSSLLEKKEKSSSRADKNKTIKQIKPLHLESIIPTKYK